jgi:hypothetical protein
VSPSATKLQSVGPLNLFQRWVLHHFLPLSRVIRVDRLIASPTRQLAKIEEYAEHDDLLLRFSGELHRYFLAGPVKWPHREPRSI